MSVSVAGLEVVECVQHCKLTPLICILLMCPFEVFMQTARSMIWHFMVILVMTWQFNETYWPFSLKQVCMFVIFLLAFFVAGSAELRFCFVLSRAALCSFILMFLCAGRKLPSFVGIGLQARGLEKLVKNTISSCSLKSYFLHSTAPLNLAGYLK